MNYLSLLTIWCSLFSVEGYFNHPRLISASRGKGKVRALTTGNAAPKVLHASDERSSVNPYEVVSTVGQSGYLPVFLLKKLIGKTISKTVGLNASLLLALFGTMDVLGSAYERNRLDGTTFKFLNLGVFASSAIFFARSYKSFGRMGMGNILGSALVLSSGATAAAKLKKHGLPNVTKIKLKGEKGYCPFSSVLFMISGITTFAGALRSLLSGTNAFGSPVGPVQASISCALLPLVSLVEHQAVLARRMQSKTYKDLNWILLLSSAVSVVTAPVGVFSLNSTPSMDKVLFSVSVLSSIAAAMLGLQVGYSLG